MKTTENREFKAKKRMEALKAAGIDTSSLFAMQTGDIARLHDGVLQVVSDDDPIFADIIDGGTINEKHLYRRWVMGQMFHLLMRGDITKQLRVRGCAYQWRMIEHELEVQSKIYEKDATNFEDRNRWFNKNVVEKVCTGYVQLIERVYDDTKARYCDGTPWVTIGGKSFFTKFFLKNVLEPLNAAVKRLSDASTPRELYLAFLLFKKSYIRLKEESISMAFIDAYKGVGAFYTIQNMIRFHDCKYAGCATERESIEQLNSDAKTLASRQEGWKFIGILKDTIENNGFDVEAKIASWRKGRK